MRSGGGFLAGPGFAGFGLVIESGTKNRSACSTEAAKLPALSLGALAPAKK